MENTCQTDNKESAGDNLRSNSNSSIEKKKSSILVEVDASLNEGKDFPDLCGHTSIFIEDNIVLFGGMNSNMERNNKFHIFNQETGAWTQKELKGETGSIPKPRYCHTANVIGNNIYIIGGGLEGNIGDNNVYSIDFDTQMCQIIGEIIDPIVTHTADVQNQSICIFGGYNLETDVFSSNLLNFNLLTNECKEIKSTGFQPKGRGSHQSAIVKDNLYIFGGCVTFGFLQDMISIDLSTNMIVNIEQHGSIPSPRRLFSFFNFAGKLYLFGGRSNSGTFQDFFSFNLKTQCWEKPTTNNQKCLLKRSSNSMVVVKESSSKLKVYLVGGLESYDFKDVQKNMNVLTMFSNRIFWILHYLQATSIHDLPGYCLVQEIIELFE